MSRKYKFRDQRKLYFVSFPVVYWIDVFNRDEYRRVLLNSLKYKGLEVYAYCIKTSHVHLIIGSQRKAAKSGCSGSSSGPEGRTAMRYRERLLMARASIKCCCSG